VSSYYFGQSIEVLAKYAWDQSNSQDHAWSCGSLLPNDLGLSDMLGNVIEWAQDSMRRSVLAKRGLSIDILNIGAYVYDKNPRLLRGGSFDNQPPFVRSAGRYGYAPAYRDGTFGFRPSRTLP
jgi:formylglycine-generating enzyme required for sulfatase activity